MSVADVMTDAVVMVDPDEHLDVAELLMLLVESRHVPVVDQGALVGVISLRDLLAAQLPSTGATEDERWQHLKTLRAHEAMSRPPVVARLHDSIAQAAHRMLTHRISCLPVVDGEQLVGIVTSTDLVRCAVKRLRAQADSTGATPKIGQLMTPEPLMVAQFYERLDAAQLYMQYEKCRHLPVLDGTRLVGMLSDRDLLGALRSRLEALPATERLRHASAIEVAAIMTPDPYTITTDADAAAAGDLLIERNVGALPVLAGERLVGIVTESDFLKFLLAPVAACPRAA